MTSRWCIPMFFYFVLTVCLIYPPSLANGYNLFKVRDRSPYKIPVPKRLEILQPYENELDNSVLEEVNYNPSALEYSLAKSLRWLNTQAEITQKRFRSKLDELYNRRTKDDEEYPTGLLDGD